MSKVAELSSVQLTPVDSITIELVEAGETLAVVIVRWPLKPSVLHPRRFPAAADAAARTFAAAVIALAQLRRDRKLSSQFQVLPVVEPPVCRSTWFGRQQSYSLIDVNSGSPLM